MQMISRKARSGILRIGLCSFDFGVVTPGNVSGWGGPSVAPMTAASASPERMAAIASLRHTPKVEQAAPTAESLDVGLVGGQFRYGFQGGGQGLETHRSASMGLEHQSEQAAVAGIEPPLVDPVQAEGLIHQRRVDRQRQGDEAHFRDAAGREGQEDADGRQAGQGVQQHREEQAAGDQVPRTIVLGPLPQLSVQRRGELLFNDATICYDSLTKVVRHRRRSKGDERNGETIQTWWLGS